MSASLPVAPSDTPLPMRGAPPVLAAVLAARADAPPADVAPTAVTAAIGAPMPSAATADAVAQAFAAFRACLDSGDYAGAMDSYADDPRFAWIEDGQVRYRSRAEVARAFEQLRAMGPVRFAYGDPHVALLARDLALLTVAFETTVGAGPQAYAFRGTMTVTMLRTGAAWRFLVGHSSSNRARIASR